VGNKTVNVIRRGARSFNIRFNDPTLKNRSGVDRSAPTGAQAGISASPGAIER